MTKTTKYPAPRPLKELQRSEGRYIWLWNEEFGWKLHSFGDVEVMLSDGDTPAISIPTPEAANV